MSTTTAKQDIKPSLSQNGGNGSTAIEKSETPESVHKFQEEMGSHPLWQMYLEEMAALRRADIAEANRVADLELGL